MSGSETSLDIITIGRSGVDLYGEQVGTRLENMRTFAKYVGGCPANIAVGTSRLGLKSGIITRVGADHMGRFLKEQFAREGVSLVGISDDPNRLTALVILGIRDSEQFPLIFYRENCADMALSPDDVSANFVLSSKSILITGTHLSQAGPLAASRKAVSIAKAAGRKIVFDVDFRPVLWGLTGQDRGEDRFVSNSKVTNTLQSIIGDCDLIVGTEEELHILGGSTNTIEAMQNIRTKTNAEIVCKRGAYGCAVFTGDIPAHLDDGIIGDGYPVEVFNVLGAGDAFLSGYLRGWIKGLPTVECCRYANASGAIVVSRHGCAPAIPTWLELQHFIKRGGVNGNIRDDRQMSHIHWATTRDKTYQDVKIFAIDHRSQFDDMLREIGVDDSRVPKLKKIALQVVHEIAQGDSSFGMLLDGRFGKEALEQSADCPYWMARPVELPGSRPLQFEHKGDIAVELLSWPTNIIVKCLVFYHPDDSVELRTEQENQLIRLFDACRNTGHEFLLEIISSKHGDVRPDTVSRVLEKMYALGIYPDWWKLEPLSDDEAWKNVENAIEKNDPLCRGIVILGLAADRDELVESFTISAKYPLVKGFAIGRTIFQEPARAWLAGNISDDELFEKFRENFEFFIHGWEAAKKLAAESVDMATLEELVS